MSRELHIEAEESVPPDATVRHYDELGQETKERLPDLVGDGPTRIPPGDAADLDAGEYIKFTEYVRVTARSSAASD